MSAPAISSQRRIGKVSKPVQEVSPTPQIHWSGVRGAMPVVARWYQGKKRRLKRSAAEATTVKRTRAGLRRERSMAATGRA